MESDPEIPGCVGEDGIASWAGHARSTRQDRVRRGIAARTEGARTCGDADRVVRAVPVVAREEQVVVPTGGDQVRGLDGPGLPGLVRHQQGGGVGAGHERRARRGQLLRPDFGRARATGLPHQVGRSVGIDERRRVDGSAERLLALQWRRRLVGKGSLGSVGRGHRNALLPGSCDVDRVIQQVGTADRGDGGCPGVVGCRPGRKARQRITHSGPVGQVIGVDDLDVAGDRVRGVGVVGLAHEDDHWVGEVEGVDQSRARAAGQLRTGS